MQIRIDWKYVQMHIDHTQRRCIQHKCALQEYTYTLKLTKHKDGSETRVLRDDKIQIRRNIFSEISFLEVLTSALSRSFCLKRQDKVLDSVVQGQVASDRG